MPEHGDKSIREHEAILEAMRERRHAAVRKLMSDHIVESGDGLIKFLEEQGLDLELSLVASAEPSLSMPARGMGQISRGVRQACRMIGCRIPYPSESEEVQVARPTYIVGSGMTPFGKFPSLQLGTLGGQAVVEALADAGISPQEIELIACGCARSGQLQGRESGVGQLVGWQVGIQEVPVYNEKAYCASGAMAFNVANMAVAGGFHDVALVVGVERMSSRGGKGRPITSDGMEFEGELGFTPSVYYAMAARRHMEVYGTTREQIAGVAVKNRRLAADNPKAQYRHADHGRGCARTRDR